MAHQGFDRNQIATALQGFSAGIGGQLPGFLEQQDRKKQRTALATKEARESSVGRQKALLIDGHTAFGLASAGNFQAVADLMGARIAEGPNFPGVDMTATQDMFTMANRAAQGDPDAAGALLPFLKRGADLAESLKLVDVPGQEKAQADLRLRQAQTRKIEQDLVQESKPLVVPPALLQGASSAEAAQAKAAFVAAGGGKDGVKALNAQRELFKTTTQRQEVPNILQNSFPNATPEEMTQLQATVDSAKSVESGFKAADKIRTEQRRLKKAGGFKQRAVNLLDNILSSDQLGDVIGSIEGAIDFRFSDVEAELIADIQEAQNILTAENMDLMTGVLSESDIRLLKNLSSGALNRQRSEARFIKDATELRNKLAGADLPEPQVTATDAQGNKIILRNGQWQPL